MILNKHDITLWFLIHWRTELDMNLTHLPCAAVTAGIQGDKIVNLGMKGTKFHQQDEKNPICDTSAFVQQTTLAVWSFVFKCHMNITLKMFTKSRKQAFPVMLTESVCWLLGNTAMMNLIFFMFCEFVYLQLYVNIPVVKMVHHV